MDAATRRSAVAEFFGTFVLVFIGAAAVVTATSVGGGVVVPALGHGLILIGLIYGFGHISGGHFNPAVTLAALVAGKIDAMRAVVYWIVQFAGGIVAGLLCRAIFDNAAIWPDAALAGSLSSSILSTGPTIGSLTAGPVWTAALLEAVLTFIFVSVIFQVAMFGRAGNLAPIAIGLTLAACILAGGPVTGASLNPARTLGPALASGDLSYVVPYLIGIFAGGVVAALVQTRLLNE